jgi:hypothetical protein
MGRLIRCGSSNTLAYKGKANIRQRGKCANGEGLLGPSPPPTFLIPRRIKMKHFFGTTLATLSVYAAWSAWYAGQNWNSIALASKQ